MSAAMEDTAIFAAKSATTAAFHPAKILLAGPWRHGALTGDIWHPKNAVSI
jgi:hypothetical protein